MAQATALSTPSIASVPPAADGQRAVWRDPGPWLVLIGPVSLFMTLVAVVLLSRSSF